jgi:hypothetical protein
LSWDDDGRHNGDSGKWARPTTSASGSRKSRDLIHLLLRHLFFSLDGPDGTSVEPIGLGRDHRFGNELPSVALVDACLTIGIDLTLIYDTGNINTLQRVEHGCHTLLCDVMCIGTLVELEQMSELVDVSILAAKGLIKAFDVTFLMVRQLVGVGMLWYESGSPGPDKQWKVTGV